MSSDMLHEFVAVHRDELIRRCRTKVAGRSEPTPTEAEIDHGVPLFLEQLVSALRCGLSSSTEISRSAVLHGHDLLLQGFTLSQVVHDYGDVCQSITDLAVEASAPISADDFRTLNGCLDEAIAGAVTQYARDGSQLAVDGEAARASVRLGVFAHELRNLINTAILAFDALTAGEAGLAGSTGTVLRRSLLGAGALISRSLAEVRVTQGLDHPEEILVVGFIDEVAAAATLGAQAQGITLAVMPVEAGLVIEADRQVLAAVMMNLLHNALKFTRPRTTVTLRVGASADRVLLEVQDECGGLAEASVNEIFRPFEQRGSNRTGLGLGLATSRRSVEANHGRLYVRNLPGVGCIFTVNLPRFPAPILPGATLEHHGL